MASYNVSIDLAKIKGAKVANNRAGHRMVCIDLTESNCIVDNPDKGTSYLYLTAWENRNGADQWGKTHYIKPSLTKAARESGDTGDVIVGNLRPWEKKQASAPKQEAPQAPAFDNGDDDDLPF